MKALYILACIMLLISATFAGEYEPRLSGDTYVDADEADENFATEDVLWASSVEDNPVKEVYLSFGGVSGKTEEEILNATLTVNVTEVSKRGNVSAYFCNSTQVEDAITWNNKPDYSEEPASTAEIDEPGMYTFDATEIVQAAAVECRGCPFMIVLVALDDASIELVSSDGDEEFQAKLNFTTSDDLT